MNAQDSLRPKFKELNPDAYRLTSEPSVVLDAAWQVLQTFETEHRGEPQLYTEPNKVSTLEYLRGGGEERPHNIFGVSVSETIYGEDGQFDILVDNRNGRGDYVYRSILRNAVAAVGIEEPEA